MGYYVSITDSTASIPRDFEPEAVRRIHALAGKDMDFAKSGGSWQGGAKTEAWYSWSNDEDMLKAKTLEDVFEAIGFESEPTEDGTGVRISGWEGKTGQEDLFLFALRDLFEDDSYIRWTGEDGAAWEIRFLSGDYFYRAGGWDPTPSVKQRVRIFSYGFDKGRLYVDVVDASMPPTDEEKAGNRFPDTTADFLSALAPTAR